MVDDLGDFFYNGDDIKPQVILKILMNQSRSIDSQDAAIRELVRQSTKTEKAIEEMADNFKEVIKLQKDIEHIADDAKEAKDLAKKALNGIDEKISKSNNNNRWFFGLASGALILIFSSYSDKVSHNSDSVNNLRIHITDEMSGLERKLVDKINTVKELIHKKEDK